MGQRRRKGRPISGLIVIDKPTGRSSNHVLQQIKRLFNAQKAGHTGNLDPLATGVLPICLGEATKLSSYLLAGDKRYQVTAQLGVATDSADADGNIIATSTVPMLDEEKVSAVLQQYLGQQTQIPPMYSALKVNGQPLYKLARQGIDVKRKERAITIDAINLIKLTDRSLTLDVACSKGTYIRTLIEDIAQSLDTLAHVTMLRRTHAAGYTLHQAHTIAEITAIAEQGESALDQSLQAVETILPNWHKLVLSAEQSQQIQYGQTIQYQETHQVGMVSLYNEQGKMLGIGDVSELSIVSPKRLFVFPN